MASITQQGNTWHLTGDVIIDHVTQVLEQVDALTFNADTRLDFSQVGEVDTATISLIFELQRRASKENASISLTNPSDNLMSLMHLYGVESFITQN